MCIIILNHDIWCLLLIFVLLVFRILAIKSGPSSGIKVFLQQSQKDNKNRVILPDDKWQSVGADYQQVDLSKFEGRNFASKLELLLATFSHDLSSSSSWNKLFSSLLLRFFKHVHTTVLVSWRTYDIIACLFACQGFFWHLSEILKISEEGWGGGLDCWRSRILSACVDQVKEPNFNQIVQLFIIPHCTWYQFKVRCSQFTDWLSNLCVCKMMNIIILYFSYYSLI